ncbi:MAG: glycoside hydrolase family 3 N-terminal domain-containing protein, partial [Nitrospirota bacterium]
RGLGQQVEGTTVFPCHMAFSAAINRDNKDDIRLLRQAINAISSEAVYTGINTLLIPVLDININPDNPIICTRSFGDNPYVVSWFGKEFIKGIQNKGLIACGKHFPGHGGTEIDSHKALPVIRKSINKLERCELIPFKEAIDSGVEMIMVGHLSIPAIDDLLPASLSKRVVTKILRKRLCFNGLILSDALTMDAVSKRFTPLEGPAIYGWDDIDPVRKSVSNGVDKISIPYKKDGVKAPSFLTGFTEKETAVLAVDAGIDILLHPEDVDTTAEGILEAIEDRRIPSSRIDASVKRILKVKNRLRFEKSSVDFRSNRRISESITQRSITLVKENGSILPIHKILNIPLIIVDDDMMKDTGSTLKRYFKRSALIEENAQRALESEYERKINSLHFEAKLQLKEKSYKIAVIVLFSKIAAGKGSSGMNEVLITKTKEIIKNCLVSIVVSFGSPYLLRHFTDADVLVAAYEPTEEVQESVINCIRGKVPFKGRLPVAL